MNKSINYLLRGALYASLFLWSNFSQAQAGHRTFDFKEGDEYETEMLTSSNAVLKRGTQSMNINSVTKATKSYKVTGSTAQGYTINIEIKKMDNVIDALGKTLHYDSGNPSFDTTSTILKALDFMIKKPISLTIDKYGVIQGSTDYRAEMATDTLVSFAGLQPEVFEKQTMFTLLADITYNPRLAKGYTWGDSVVVDKQKLSTKFLIEEANENNIVVKFSSIIGGKMINSSTNGTYVINTKTGLITEKLFYSVSVGYQMSAGGVVYAVSRSTSISERTRQVK